MNDQQPETRNRPAEGVGTGASVPGVSPPVPVGGSPTPETIQKQIRLPFGKAVQIAWRNIRVRLARSLLVTSGIILALAFLAYILCSDALARHLAANGPAELIETLRREGTLATLNDADTRTQTWWMVGLALLVSFVGILNAMLMSVTERFSEIGTMKCLGALDSLIVELFLLETTFQGVVGTTIGISIGLVLAFAEGLILYGSAAWRVVPLGAIAQLVGICALVGIGLTIAGALYPAWRAAKMQPVDAMRTEI
ncbi:MAG TPA: FtsX-like permease family protein [Phycisphaerae bacterium]|nr:FtsX-like permease family protein [Phycisphaerae bacterium]